MRSDTLGSALRCHLRRGQPARSLPPSTSQTAGCAWGGRRGHPRLSSVIALPAARGPAELSAELDGEERGRRARRLRGRGAEWRGVARRPEPRFVVTSKRTTNFPCISHFPKNKPKDSCECNRSLQNTVAQRSIKVDNSLDLFLFYF